MKIISPIVKCVDIFKAAKTLKEFWHILNDYVILTPVGHLITDLKKGEILNVLLYTGTNFEDLSQKHMQF